MKINSKIQKQIKNKTFNLSFHKMFSENPERLLNIGFEKNIDLLEKRIGSNFSVFELYNLYQEIFYKITSLEKNIKHELETIAVETIRELYNVPEEINIQASIVKQVELNYDLNKQKKDLNLNEKFSKTIIDKIRKEANKRIILNSIVNGSSVMIWSSAYYIAKEKIDLLNKDLILLYNQYSSIVNVLLYLQGLVEDFEDVNIESQGKCEVGFDHKGLQSFGVNFPVVLLETNKVVLDYLICKAIPEDFTEEELKLYYALSDDYRQEIWHNILSPVIYEDLLKVINKKPSEIPDVILKLCDIDCIELEQIFISVQINKTQAIEILKKYNIC